MTSSASETVSLEVEPANTEAIRFYERQGFVVTGRTGDCSGSGDGIPALIMTRRLAPVPATPRPLRPAAIRAIDVAEYNWCGAAAPHGDSDHGQEDPLRQDLG